MKPSDIYLGELREFKRATLDRLDKIEKHVDSFHSFKMRVLGAAGFCAFLATIVVELLRH